MEASAQKVEKKAVKPTTSKNKDKQAQVMDKKDDENEWSTFGSMIPTYSNDSKRGKKEKEREEMRQLNSIDRVILIYQLISS